MNMKNFTDHVLDAIHPGDSVLDIGGGDGKFAKMFVERGARVTIVDPKATASTLEQSIVETKTIEAFCSEARSEKYDAIFLRHVIQFLDRTWVFETLFSWMREHLTAHGIIAVKTFYQNPEPPFRRPVTSTYTLTELQQQFPTWTELVGRQYAHQGSDMHGQMRKFFTVDVIARAENAK
jgi:2-polyprenyl-3-methyl-5-hydroxy-6-metoxy-1,4-benzoquinol methylase